MEVRVEVAWAAGLFEGEGCITHLNTSPNHKGVRLSLAMTDRDIVERFCKTVGVGRVEYKKGQKDGYKDQWLWRVGSFEHSQAVIAMLWFGLGERRKAKAKELLLNASHIGTGKYVRK